MLHKNIIKLAALLWCVLTVASCTNEDFGKGDNGSSVREGLPVTATLNIGTPEVPVVETKSLENDGKFGVINNLAIIDYDKDGQNPKVTFVPSYTSGGVEFQTKTGTRKIYVLTNVGSEDVAQKYAGSKETDLLAWKIEAVATPFGEEKMLGFVSDKDMTTSGSMYNDKNKAPHPGLEITEDKSFYAQVVPPYSKITFEITKDLNVDDWVTLSITNVSVRNLPNKYSFLPLVEKWITANEVTSVKSAIVKNDNEQYVFYVYENLQGKGSNSSGSPLNKNPFTDGSGPIPGNGNPSKIGYGDWESKWAGETPCTYIEVEGKYALAGKNVAGTIHYRFFLGEDAVNDFNIKRNTHYKVQLAFTGVAGYDELQYEWRVQSEFNDIAVIPEGEIVIDGSPEMPLPFYIINNTGQDLSITAGGTYAGEYNTSDMKFHYSDKEGRAQSSSDLSSNIVDNVLSTGAVRISVASVNAGILGHAGHGGTGTGLMADYYSDMGREIIVKRKSVYKDTEEDYQYTEFKSNKSARTAVAAGNIFRVRKYQLNAGAGSRSFSVKEYPLLLITDDYDPNKAGTVYAQRIDRVNENDKRAMSRDDALLICPEKATVISSGSSVGTLKPTFPTVADLTSMATLEKGMAPKVDKAYWTTDGLYWWRTNGSVEKATEETQGYLRCVYKYPSNNF